MKILGTPKWRKTTVPTLVKFGNSKSKMPKSRKTKIIWIRNFGNFGDHNPHFLGIAIGTYKATRRKKKDIFVTRGTKKLRSCISEFYKGGDGCFLHFVTFCDEDSWGTKMKKNNSPHARKIRKSKIENAKIEKNNNNLDTEFWKFRGSQPTFLGVAIGTYKATRRKKKTFL